VRRAVNRDVETKAGRAGLGPERTFVIQLRSDSDLPHGRMRGRVEHVMSGDSEPFASVEGLVAFMARYAPAREPSESGGD
jgi:hypothetical protein